MAVRGYDFTSDHKLAKRCGFSTEQTCLSLLLDHKYFICRTLKAVYGGAKNKNPTMPDILYLRHSLFHSLPNDCMNTRVWLTLLNYIVSN